MPANSVLPAIAIVGRPNVGKSTLFNRIVGSRRAIVGDEPGITRDRLYSEAEWSGRRFRVIDTGGIVPEDKDLIPAEIFRHAKLAFDEAAAVIMVVDLRTELAAPDIELARLLQRLGKPLFLAVNKVDDPKLEPEAENFRRLGIRNLWPVSAEHGTGVAELLDAVLEVLPAAEAEQEPSADSAVEDSEEPEESSERGMPSEIRVAIIGRPNVGKSTLLNALTGVDRAIVSPIPGTTRDAVDELVIRDDQRLRFIDTAGIRRKGKTHLMAEKLSVVMARKHMEAADVTLLILDAVTGVENAEQTIGGYAHESGRSVIVVVNKWDLVGPGRPAGKGEDAQRPADRGLYEEQIRATLKFLPYAPIVFVSASQKKGIDRLYSALAEVARERYKRITTGEMNRFLKTVDFDRASVPFARKVKIYYMTQVSVGPPTFLLFTNKDVKLHFSYERYLENRIREAFGFVGTPIRLRVRAREKREYIPKPKKRK